MKKLLFYAAALLAAISFQACSDDDENGLPATPENIAGTWQIVQEKGWEIDWDEKDTFLENYPDKDGWYYTFTFDKDGSFTVTEIWGKEDGGDTSTENGSYSISGKELRLNIRGYNQRHIEIRKLTKSQLVLFVIMDYDLQSEYTATFKRIE